MKVYTLTNEYPGLRSGGIGTYISQLKEVLGDRMSVDSVAVFPSRFALVRRLYRATKKGDQIWVHHVFPVGFAAFLLHLFAGRHYTVFLHGNDFDTVRAHRVRRVLLRFILKGARQVVTNSHALAQDVEHAYGIIPTVLNPWLPTDFQEALGSVHFSEANFNGRNTILTVGRFVPRKGFALLIDVAEKSPAYQFIFVGPKNAYAEELEKSVHARGLSNVMFKYDLSRAQTIELFKSAAIFAMPTTKTIMDREGFGIVYLEAQYAGLPVVATCYKESLEALSPTLGPYLLQMPTVEDCLMALQRIVDHPINRQELHNFVTEYHTIKSRAHIIESLYA